MRSSWNKPPSSTVLMLLVNVIIHLGEGLVPSFSSATNHRTRMHVEAQIPCGGEDEGNPSLSRRTWLTETGFRGFGAVFAGSLLSPSIAHAMESKQVTESELDELYDNPEMPSAPEERSGLVVLRVAEVAQFQEKILRAIVSGDLDGVKVAPMQFVFGTQILLRNSNLDGNMKLMIYNEIPRKNRKKAIANAVVTMNTLQDISKYASSIQRDFEPEEMIRLADMYREVRINLNQMYEYLSETEKDKYYGYFEAVTQYEKKVAEGTYNPDIDGVLKFD